MFACLIFGDSIGVGTAQAVHRQYHGRCEVQAIERATTAQILSWQPPARIFGTSVLSMGSNDQAGEQLRKNLLRIRMRILTRRAIWILPYSRPQAYIISRIAVAFGDETIDLARFATIDRIHPQRYGDLAAALLK